MTKGNIVVFKDGSETDIYYTIDGKTYFAFDKHGTKHTFNQENLDYLPIHVCSVHNMDNVELVYEELMELLEYGNIIKFNEMSIEAIVASIERVRNSVKSAHENVHKMLSKLTEKKPSIESKILLKKLNEEPDTLALIVSDYLTKKSTDADDSLCLILKYSNAKIGLKMVDIERMDSLCYIGTTFKLIYTGDTKMCYHIKGFSKIGICMSDFIKKLRLNAVDYSMEYL